MKHKNNQNGITLIVVIILIVALLILVGVGITILIKKNGMQTKVNDAKTQEIAGSEREKKEVKTKKRELEYWEITTVKDKEWYSYQKDKIEGPKLKGEMVPIKYIGESQEGNKWANSMTADGSMFVWIPRYAYKITEGYHSEDEGTIEVAFISTENNFLNDETGEITTNPSEEGAGTTKWLVHPAFTSNASNGGGFGELEGLWIGKFKATGTETNLSVQPGEKILCNMTINAQYQLAKESTFGENESINSHMAKNSEWGAIVYLGHSKYGTNGKKIENNESESEDFYTGGSNNKKTIYTTNKLQSTTHNATGVYDLYGGAWEYVASYVDNGGKKLSENGGTKRGDLYGETKEERMTSTAYKMVYDGINDDYYKDYEDAKKYKGDAVYETSAVVHPSASWFGEQALFPNSVGPFFNRIGAFAFLSYYGYNHKAGSFRPVLAF